MRQNNLTFLVESRSRFFAFLSLASWLLCLSHKNPSLSVLIVKNNIKILFIQTAFFWSCKPVFVDYRCLNKYFRIVKYINHCLKWKSRIMGPCVVTSLAPSFYLVWTYYFRIRTPMRGRQWCEWILVSIMIQKFHSEKKESLNLDYYRIQCEFSINFIFALQFIIYFRKPMEYQFKVTKISIWKLVVFEK